MIIIQPSCLCTASLPCHSLFFNSGLLIWSTPLSIPWLTFFSSCPKILLQSQCHPLAPCSISFSNLPWFFLHIMTPCHIHLICANLPPLPVPISSSQFSDPVSVPSLCQPLASVLPTPGSLSPFIPSTFSCTACWIWNDFWSVKWKWLS